MFTSAPRCRGALRGATATALAALSAIAVPAAVAGSVLDRVKSSGTVRVCIWPDCVDVFMTDYPYSRRLLDNADWARLISPPQPFYVLPYAYAVKPGDAERLTRVDEFVVRIQRDGRLETAAKKHGLSPIVRLK